MNKKDILQKHKASKPKDERIEYINSKANKCGVKGILSVLVIVIIYNAIKGIRNMAFLSLMFAYLGMESYGRYKAFKDTTYIYGAILGIITSIVYLANYIVDTI